LRRYIRRRPAQLCAGGAHPATTRWRPACWLAAAGRAGTALLTHYPLEGAMRNL